MFFLLYSFGGGKKIHLQCGIWWSQLCDLVSPGLVWEHFEHIPATITHKGYIEKSPQTLSSLVTERKTNTVQTKSMWFIKIKYILIRAPLDNRLTWLLDCWVGQWTSEEGTRHGCCPESAPLQFSCKFKLWVWCWVMQQFNWIQQK